MARSSGPRSRTLNADGSPEVYVYVQSAGSGSYGSLVAFSANNPGSARGTGAVCGRARDAASFAGATIRPRLYLSVTSGSACGTGTAGGWYLDLACLSVSDGDSPNCLEYSWEKRPRCAEPTIERHHRHRGSGRGHLEPFPGGLEPNAPEHRHRRHPVVTQERAMEGAAAHSQFLCESSHGPGVAKMSGQQIPTGLRWHFVRN